MMSASVRRAKRLEVYKAPNRRRGIWQNDPVIGARFIYVSQYAGGTPPKPGQGEVAALERTTLTREWRAETEGLSAIRELDEGALCVADTGRVGALDASSGRLLWVMPRRTGAHRRLDGLLTFETERTLVAVNARTGEKRVVFTAPEKVSFSVMCDDKLILNIWDNEGLHLAYDLPTWTLIWEVDLLREATTTYGLEDIAVSLTPGSLPGSFVMTAGTATLGGSLVDGSVRWKADVWCLYRRPLVQGGRIPILTLEEFVVLDEATGAVLCRRKHGLAHVWHARPGSLVSDDVFGTVTEEGHVMLFDMNTAELLSWAQHSVSFHGTAAADGRFFVVGSDGKLWVYEPFS